MRNLYHKFLASIKIIFLSHLFLTPSCFFISPHYYFYAILFFIWYPITSYFFNYLGWKKEEIYKRVDCPDSISMIIFITDYVFLTIKQFFICYAIFKIIMIYWLTATMFYIIMSIMLLYNIFIIILDNRANNIVISIFQLCTVICFYIIFFSEYDITYQSVDLWHQNNFFWNSIGFLCPLFFFTSSKLTVSPSKSDIFLITMKTFFIMGLSFLTIICLKNKLHFLIFNEKDFFANIIIKNYTKLNTSIHSFYLFLLIYIFFQGYDTYQAQIHMSEQNMKKIGLAIIMIACLLFLSRYIISLKILFLFTYSVLIIYNLISSIIIYHSNKNIYPLSGIFVIIILHTILFFI